MTGNEEEFRVPADRLHIHGSIGPWIPELTTDTDDPLTKSEIGLLAALANKAPHSERAVLEEFASRVIHGARVNSFLQCVVNVLVAKAVLTGRLPQKKQGPTPEQIPTKGFLVAFAYFRLVDEGMQAGLAAATLQEQFFLGEKQIKRLAKANSWMVGGDDPEERKRFREKWDRAARAINEHRPKDTVPESNRPRRKRPNSDAVAALDSWIARALQPLMDA